MESDSPLDAEHDPIPYMFIRPLSGEPRGMRGKEGEGGRGTEERGRGEREEGKGERERKK